MATLSGNNHEIRDKIKRVQELLGQEIERVDDLKNLLSIAEDKVARLKEELDEYQARITPTPINSCPSEILSMIFRLSIPKDGDIQHMGHLLLVCKRWYTLVVNDPQMWNTIKICAPTHWDIRSWSNSTRLYLESCVERSRATSLNIDLNFFLLQTTKEQLIDRLHSGFFDLPSSAQTWIDHDLIYDWLCSLDYEALEDNTDTAFDCLPDHAIQLIGKLFGADEDIMQRWESLTLWFPSSIGLVPAIWEQLAPKTINLSRIHLVGLGWGDLLEADDEDDGDLPRLSLPQVKDLRIRALYGWDRFLSFDPSSLHKLSVNTFFETGFFSEIGRFNQLRTLTLATSTWDPYVAMEKDQQNRICLPMLQELVLVGVFINLEAVTFDLPSLKRLVVEWRVNPLAIRITMPMVQPSEVHWAPDDKPYFQEDILRVADAIIRDFLLQYASSDCFSVTSFLKANVLKVIKELSTEGVFPPKWRTVSFHDNSGGIERMHIDNIVCR